VRPLQTILLALAAACPAAAADTINAVFPAPALDRWMYPFNSYARDTAGDQHLRQHAGWHGLRQT